MDNLMNEKLWTIVHNNRVHDKLVGYKLLLSDLKWNDYGYYTYFQLFLQLKENKDANLKIADLNILNIGQKAGESPVISTEIPMITFIRDIESAYMLLFLLTFKERKELITSLNIRFQCEAVRNEPAFQKSVLRGTTEMAFKLQQEEIRQIMTCPLDISTAFTNYKERINMV